MGRRDRWPFYSAVSFPQHPDEHRPERPVLLAVDQELNIVYLVAVLRLGFGTNRRHLHSKNKHGPPVESLWMNSEW